MMQSLSKAPESGLRAVFIPTHGSEEELARAAFLTSLADPTPRGRQLTELAARKAGAVAVPQNSRLIYAEGEQSLCGIDLQHEMLRTGSIDQVEDWLRTSGGYFHMQLRRITAQLESRGDQVIIVANEEVDLGVIALTRH